MTSCKRNYQYLVIVASLIIMVNVQPVLAKYTIPVDCYYSASTGCGRCVRIKTVVQDIEQNYSGKITVTWKDVDLAEYKKEGADHGFTSYPSIVINNELNIPNANFTGKQEKDKEYLETIFNSYLSSIQDKNHSIPEQFITVVSVVGIILLLVVLAFIAWRKDKQS